MLSAERDTRAVLSASTQPKVDTALSQSVTKSAKQSSVPPNTRKASSQILGLHTTAAALQRPWKAPPVQEPEDETGGNRSHIIAG